MNKKGNTSSAVMEQRHEALDSLDDFPTPPWATRALLEFLRNHCAARFGTVWEPACNRGYMARPLAEYFHQVIATDVHDYGWTGQQALCDFTLPGLGPQMVMDHGVDWIFTNPPFVLAEDFALRALDLKPRGGVLLVVRLSFLDTLGRYERLWSKAPPAIIAQFAERVPMVKGRFDPDASTATAYCALIWRTGHTGPTEMHWIPPGQRKRLSRAGDVDWSKREG